MKERKHEFFRFYEIEWDENHRPVRMLWIRDGCRCGDPQCERWRETRVRKAKKR